MIICTALPFMRKEAGKSRKKQKRNDEQMDIARKKKAIICLGVVLLLSLNAYFTRSEKVRSNYWKNTNEKGLVGEHGNVADFLWFSQDGWQYEFPIVKRNGKVKRRCLHVPHGALGCLFF